MFFFACFPQLCSSWTEFLDVPLTHSVYQSLKLHSPPLLLPLAFTPVPHLIPPFHCCHQSGPPPAVYCHHCCLLIAVNLDKCEHPPGHFTPAQIVRGGWTHKQKQKVPTVAVLCSCSLCCKSLFKKTSSRNKPQISSPAREQFHNKKNPKCIKKKIYEEPQGRMTKTHKSNWQGDSRRTTPWGTRGTWPQIKPPIWLNSGVHN